MKKMTGFSFKKKKNGDVQGVPGHEVLPHRVELIEKMMNLGKDPSDLFFNFKAENCINPSGAKEIEKEIQLFEKWESGDWHCLV